MRTQSKRNNNGYKLHVGAVCSDYVESTMLDGTFNSIMSSLYTEICDKATEGLRLHRECCQKLGYVGPSLGTQLDLPAVANEENITFSVSYGAEAETIITRVGLPTRAFPGSHTTEDIEQWIEKARV